MKFMECHIFSKVKQVPWLPVVNPIVVKIEP